MERKEEYFILIVSEKYKGKELKLNVEDTLEQ